MQLNIPPTVWVADIVSGEAVECRVESNTFFDRHTLIEVDGKKPKDRSREPRVYGQCGQITNLISLPYVYAGKAEADEAIVRYRRLVDGSLLAAIAGVFGEKS